jgi:hypothetical protein
MILLAEVGDGKAALPRPRSRPSPHTHLIETGRSIGRSNPRTEIPRRVSRGADRQRPQGDSRCPNHLPRLHAPLCPLRRGAR